MTAGQTDDGRKTILTIHLMVSALLLPFYLRKPTVRRLGCADWSGRDGATEGGRAEVAGKRGSVVCSAVGKEKVIESPGAVSKECHRLQQQQQQQTHERKRVGERDGGRGGMDVLMY